MMVSDSIIQVLILNNVNFGQYLSQDYRDNIHVIEITKEFCTPNKQGVKYFHLLSGFKEDPILGYKFDAISDPLGSLYYLGICPNLYRECSTKC